MKKLLIALMLICTTGLVGVGVTSAAEATDPHKCYEQVVDQPAYDEVVPGTPSKWWNWSPNKDQGPFEGPPAFPADDRGTWQGPHMEGGPGQDQTGTFQQGEGHGSWFHREAGTPDTTVHHDATYKDVEVPCDRPDPVKPEPLVGETSSTSYTCGDDFQTTEHQRLTWDWVLEDGTWVKTKPVVKSWTTTEAHEIRPCRANSTKAEGLPNTGA